MLVLGRETRRERVPVARGFWWRGTKESRRDGVPVARAFVVVRKRNQEGEGTCGPGILVGG